MKRTIIALLFVAFMVSICSAQPPKILRFTSLEYPPYAGQSVAGNGVAIHKVRLALGAQDIKMLVIFFP